MKKLLLVFLFISAIAKSQTITFTDANFKSKLLEASPQNEIAAVGGNYVKIDLNNDSEIQVAEAQLIDSLKITSGSILNLEGIQYFNALKKVNFDTWQVADFDASGLPQLEELVLASGLLHTISLSGLSNLKKLEIASTNLPSINLSGLISLEDFSIISMEMPSLDVTDLTNLRFFKMQCAPLQSLIVSDLLFLEVLDVNHSSTLNNLELSNLPSLKVLYFPYTAITQIDLSGVPSLEKIDFEGCPVQNIDFSGLPLLKELSCYYTPIIALDLSANPLLEKLQAAMCGSLEIINLTGAIGLKSVEIAAICTALDFSDAVNLESIGLYGMPNLQSLSMKNGHRENFYFEGPFINLSYVCADEPEVEILQLHLGEAVEINTYCTTAPAGNPNTISGNVSYNFTNAGCVTLASPDFIRFKIDDGATQGTSYSANNSYHFFTGAGEFTIIPEIENAAFFTVTPTSATVNFATATGNQAQADFCISANSLHSDVEAVIVPQTGARPGFDSEYQLLLHNKGNQVVSGNVAFVYDEAVFDLINALPAADLQNAGSMTYNFTDLSPFETRTFQITLNLNGPMEIPAVNIDDLLSFNAVATIIGLTDETPDDNTAVLKQLVVGSFDPNDKHCLEGATVNPQRIGDYLHYVINFENTGTAPAENVVVRDIIDESQFDEATLQVLGSSHPVATRINGNRVEFFFNGIELQASEHGHVVFKIKTNSALQTNDSVVNKADIFFDYNFPVATDPATTTFSVLGTDKFTEDNSVSVYPNPAGDFLKVQAKELIKSIELFDVQGRIVHTSIVESKEITMNLNRYSKGIYYLRVHTDGGIKSEKLIKK